MTVVIAFVPKPAGWAALSAGIEEAQRRGEPVHVVNVSRGDQLVDPGYASPEELQELRSRLELSGLGSPSITMSGRTPPPRQWSRQRTRWTPALRGKGAENLQGIARPEGA